MPPLFASVKGHGRGRRGRPPGRGSPVPGPPAEAPIAVELVIVLALVIANGILSGAETAMTALRRGQLSDLVEQGNRAARVVARLRDDPERLLATIQITLTLVGTTAAVVAGDALVSRLAALLGGVDRLGPWAKVLAMAVVIAGLSLLVIVLGELVPKSFALRTAPTYALLAARPLDLASRLLRPFVWFATAASNLLLRAFRDETTFTESRLSPDELAQLIEDATRSGSIHPKAGDIAVRALDFGDVEVSAVMVPRTRIVALSIDSTADEIRRVLLEENHSSFPVYDGTLDELVGVVRTSDVLALAWERELIVLHDLLRPPHFVPENMRAADVLREMQRERVHFAIVVDERGGTAGLVTLKDLLEELVGELFARGDRPPEHVRSQTDGSFVVPGNMAVRDANRELPFELPEGEDFATVGGLATSLAGRLPSAGDRFVTDDGIPLEVIDASPRRVRWVRVGPAATRPS